MDGFDPHFLICSWCEEQPPHLEVGERIGAMVMVHFVVPHSTSRYHWCILLFQQCSSMFHHVSMISPWFSHGFLDFPSFFPSFFHIFPQVLHDVHMFFGISTRPTCREQPGTTGNRPPWWLPRAALFAMASSGPGTSQLAGDFDTIKYVCVCMYIIMHIYIYMYLCMHICIRWGFDRFKH